MSHDGARPTVIRTPGTRGRASTSIFPCCSLVENLFFCRTFESPEKVPTRGPLSKAVGSSFDSIGFELRHVVLTYISGLLSWIFEQVVSTALESGCGSARLTS